MRNNMKIGVIDSGIGGLTILKELREFLPRENLLYYGDFYNNPYSKKEQKEIYSLSYKIVEFMVRNHCKVVVVACSLFSSTVLDKLQKDFHIPIIGTIRSGVRASLVETQKRNIGLLGSQSTLDSNSYLNTINEYRDDMNVYQVAADDLGSLIEKGWAESDENLELLRSHIEKMPKDIDTLILGGTHFPLIKYSIKRYFKGNIVDSSREVLIEVLDTLIRENMLANRETKGALEFCVTGEYRALEESLPRILKREKDFNIYKLY